MVKNAIFLCVGDAEVFSFYCIDNLLDHFDLIINFFGSDDKKFELLKNKATYIERSSGTKFITLKNIYDKNNLLINKYEYVVCWDDDAIIISGNLQDTIGLAKTFNIKIISPCHDSSGKISHQIMRQYPGNHILRYTNFIEMNFPIFRADVLGQYLSIYDGSLCGFGNDWWYLSTIDATNESNYACAINDSFVVNNPHNYYYTDKDKINNFVSIQDRKKQWQMTKTKYGLTEWNQKTLAYVHNINNTFILTPTKLLP